MYTHASSFAERGQLLISFTVSDPDGGSLLDGFLADLGQAIDLGPVADEICLAVEVDNAVSRTAGLDKEGEPFLDITESTEKWRRKHKKGSGPPLAPDFAGSTIISTFTSDWERADAFTWNIYGNYPAWVQYHIDGIPRPSIGDIAVRNPCGVSPDGMAKLKSIFDIGVSTAYAKAG